MQTLSGKAPVIEMLKKKATYLLRTNEGVCFVDGLYPCQVKPKQGGYNAAICKKKNSEKIVMFMKLYGIKKIGGGKYSHKIITPI